MTESDEPQIFNQRYQIIKKLGAGNFGTAYLVSDLKAKHEPKVLKVVRLGEMDSTETVESVREAQLLSKLKSEHIVKFHESFLENDCVCIVTEFCEGGDLDMKIKELKKENKQLSEDQVVEWLVQILIAVQHMHKSKVLHRDLKTRNIFLKANKIKIGDFGISRILVGTMDVATTFTGTPYFMSPEVMKHDGYSSKSDIWSVGCLLYEMCTFQHAFDGKGLMNVIYKVVEGKTPELPVTYSKELNDVLKKMFIKEPQNRPSAAELLESSFIQKHRDRIKMTGPLENTIVGNLRSKELASMFSQNLTVQDMQKQKWSISGNNQLLEEGDDDEDVVSETNGNNRLNDNDDKNEQTLKQLEPNEYTQQKTPSELAKERKRKDADARAQMYTEAIRANAHEAATHRQLMRESTFSSLKQPWPSDDHEHSMNKSSKIRSNDKTLCNQTYSRNTLHQSLSQSPYSIDERPITPMRQDYRQIAERGFNRDGIPVDPNLTNEYYSNFNQDFEPPDTSPTRENAFHDQVCRSIDGGSRSNPSQRTMSASHRSINSLSRTIDPRQRRISPSKSSKYLASSRTIGQKSNVMSSNQLTHDSSKGRATSSRSNITDDNNLNITLKDNPLHDAYGPISKNIKINNLRTKAMKALGEETFEIVHDYLLKQRKAQRNDPTIDEVKVLRELESFVKKPSDCFLVDQLVFLEIM